MDKQNDIIDKYLQGLLSEKELLDFNRQLATDNDFKQLVEEQEAIHYGLLAFGNEQLKADLDVIHQEEIVNNKEVKTETKKVRSVLPWSIAAAITVLLIALAYLFYPKGAINPNDLFTQYYEPYKTSIVERNSTVADQLVQIEQLYNQKKFKEVIPLIHDVMKADGNKAKLQLILGIAYLETGELDKAQFQFGDIDNLLYDDKAQWYSVLISLKKNDLVNAKRGLQILERNTESNYHKKAIELLDKLD